MIEFFVWLLVTAGRVALGILFLGILFLAVVGAIDLWNDFHEDEEDEDELP